MGQQWAWAAGFGLIVVAQPGWAQEVSPLAKGDLGGSPVNIPRLRDMDRPATSLKEWLAQMEAAVGQITGVEIKPTETELQIVFTVPSGGDFQILTTREKNTLTATIQNARLNLTGDNRLQKENLTPEISRLEITPGEGNSIQIKVIGVNGAPRVQFQQQEGQLTAGVTPTTEAVTTTETQETKPETKPDMAIDDDIKIVVTGEGQQGYFVPNSSIGTRTDTPLLDIPQSIQVVPQEVLRDQNVTNLNDALRNVPGVAPATSSTTNFVDFLIRGFITESGESNNFLRNGLRDAGVLLKDLSPNVERIEVLKGPVSALYGQASPGGTINVVTKQPLRDPFYAVDATVGNFDFYQGAIDLSEPLNDSRTVLYRFNAGYQNARSFIDFYEREQFTIAPVVSFAIGERTRFTVEGEYSERRTVHDPGLPVIGTVLPNPNERIPLNRLIGEPDSVIVNKIGRLGFRLDHKFSENWSLQSGFQWKPLFATVNNQIFENGFDADNRTLNRVYRQLNGTDTDIYDLNVNLTGRFSTGSIGHQLVFGVDLGRLDRTVDLFGGTAAPIDVFNPVYGQPVQSFDRLFFGSFQQDTLGIYIQDQVTLIPNLKLLLGGRFDLVTQTNQDFVSNSRTSQSSDAFSPRVGIVYQPVPSISLYASYTRSFFPLSGTTFEGDLFQPERATQYEVGVKTDLNDQLSATLALYDLTRSNVLTNDPDNPDFSIQTGEQRSQGVELTVQGEILPGWNIIAGYAYTDARITQDNAFPVGNRLDLVPENAFNLWTTYEIQSGDLRGLGFGVGFFAVSDRQGDLDNSFQLPSYLRTDAAIFYRRDRFRVALNVKNLFNVDYFEAFRVGGVFPGEPFTVQGRISWTF